MKVESGSANSEEKQSPETQAKCNGKIGRAQKHFSMKVKSGSANSEQKQSPETQAKCNGKIAKTTNQPK